MCEFCSLHINYVSFRNLPILNKLVNYQGKILPTRITGTCAKHQRTLALAIKRARYMAIMPYSKPRIRLQKQLVLEKTHNTQEQTTA